MLGLAIAFEKNRCVIFVRFCLAKSGLCNWVEKGFEVQRIGWILAIILALCWLASEIPLPTASSSDQPRVQTCWRRTADGWENASQWGFYTITHKPTFHPFYVSIIQCTAVVWIAASCCLFKHVSKPTSKNLQHSEKKPHFYTKLQNAQGTENIR
jgi:hypothetical protein